MARVVGHGMTRKFTEREDRRIGARGLTRRREGHEGFFGMAHVVGHGMTRKFTEREDRRIRALGSFGSKLPLLYFLLTAHYLLAGTAIRRILPAHKSGTARAVR
jgi:hypothetical protein